MKNKQKARELIEKITAKHKLSNFYREQIAGSKSNPKTLSVLKLEYEKQMEELILFLLDTFLILLESNEAEKIINAKIHNFLATKKPSKKQKQKADNPETLNF